MNTCRWNGPLWSGFALSVVAFISYFYFFSRFPVTRDVPWASVLLFVAAMALLVRGVLRANRKIFASIVAVLGALVFVFFGLAVTVLSKVPASHNAPKVGQKAPEFTLLDANRHPVALASVVASAPRGVLLVFYRGYW
jgi:hypothetical protein